jgi:response regulator NasT
VADSVAKALVQRGLNVVSKDRDINNIIQSLQYYKSGVIVCGTSFGSVHFRDIYDMVPDGFTVILIGSREELKSCGDAKVFKLATPLKIRDLLCSIDMLDIVDSQYKPKDKKTKGEQDTILRAKIKLMESYHMNEEQAHRYIQKKSMSTGKSLADIAAIILEI